MRCPQICRRRTPYTHCAPARARRCRCCRTLAHAALPAVLATCSARLPPPHSLQAAVPHVLADAAAAALPAIVAPPPALANAAASALLALAAAPTVLAAPLSPPYSMHASRDNNSRCFCRRSPCRGSAAARARICWRYRTRWTGGGAARARRGSFSTTPKTPTRAEHTQTRKITAMSASFSLLI